MPKKTDLDVRRIEKPQKYRLLNELNREVASRAELKYLTPDSETKPVATACRLCACHACVPATP